MAKFYKTIRWKLNISFIAIFGTALILFSIIIYNIFAFQNRSSIDEAMITMAHSINESIHEEGFDKDILDEIKETYIPFTPYSAFFVEVIDMTGNIIIKLNQSNNLVLPIDNSVMHDAFYGKQIFQTIHLTNNDTLSGKYGIRLLLYPVNYQSAKYVLAIGVSLSNLESLLHNLRLILYLTVPIIIVLSFIFGWVYSKKAYKPVNQLIESSNYITAERLTERLPVSDTGDEISKLALTLNNMIERLENSFSILKQFTSDASHELRTPLTILRGEIEIALNKTRDTAEYKRILVNNLSEILRLQKIVDGLLLLSQLDEGKFKIKNTKINLNELLAVAVSKITPLAKKKNIRIIVNLLENVDQEDKQASVYGDEGLLLNVILNLLDNAIKYSASDSEITCSINKSLDSRTINLSIEDNGIGISKEHIAMIFERFYKVDQSRTRMGNMSAGLGLSISNAIIQTLGGRIEAESIEGKGSKFSILLQTAD